MRPEPRARGGRKAAGGTLRDGLRKYALTFPDAWEDHPWGEETVAKVGKKVFVFFGMEHGEWWPMVHLKLTVSNGIALSQAGVEPMGYGLGRSGWVSVRLDECDLPYEALAEWVEESYRAVAPKRLVKELDGRAA
jgi:predicted DNA-binding protein (MmcQ/YjbR family)